MSHIAAAFSRNPQPGLENSSVKLTGYASGSYRAKLEEGTKTHHLAGPARLSNEKPGAHAVVPRTSLALSGSSQTHYVENGQGTAVDNVGFMVRTSFNTRGEPTVFIHPYGIDSKKSGVYLSPKIDTIIDQLVRQTEKNGVPIQVDGRAVNVVPREILGVTSVLDFHGRKPIEWVRPDDIGASLREASFTFARHSVSPKCVGKI